MRKYVLSSEYPTCPQAGSPFLTPAPACTALTVSPDAVGAVDPAPRGADTQEAEAVPAEVMDVAEGKAAVLATPMAAAAEDGARVAPEGIGAEGSR